jgi:hypothetical protein
MGTSGLVTAWAPYLGGGGDPAEHELIYQGLARRVLEQTRDAVKCVKPNRVDWVPFEPEQCKRVYDELVAEHGAETRFFSFLAGVEAGESGRVEALLVAGKDGLAALRAPVYVDATGDGDLAAWAGAGFQQGDDKGDLQPGTLCFILANVDDYAYQHGVALHPNNPESPIFQIARDPKYPDIRDTHLCNALIGPGLVTFNAGHVWDLDGTHPGDVSRGLMQGRRIARQFRDALAEYFPEAFANSVVAATAPMMGIRETRRIVGDYVLSVEDYFHRRSFDDDVARNSYWIDIHTAKEEIEASLEADGAHGHVVNRYEHYRPGESHGIPYRCLTPRGLENVLVAGRSISADRSVQASVRSMPCCMAQGEAAGLAADMAAGGGGAVRGVDVPDLQGRLRGHGAYLP